MINKNIILQERIAFAIVRTPPVRGCDPLLRGGLLHLKRPSRKMRALLKG